MLILQVALDAAITRFLVFAVIPITLIRCLAFTGIYAD
jgi:hypothetical protein